MRLVLQRVSSAAVRVDGDEVARIGRGMLVLVGVHRDDDSAMVEKATEKLAGLRIFDDANGRMNLDCTAAGGSFLIVSQFTLAGSLAKGRRPSFDGSAPAAKAEPMIQALADRLADRGLPVATGRFGARMEVELVNDGPVTFVFDLRSAPQSAGDREERHRHRHEGQNEQ